MILSGSFEDALIDAKRIHARQLRKSTETPYFSHLMAVSSLVLEDGGCEKEAIAALLHDAAEDQGGKSMLRLIEERHGKKVAGFVSECSDTFETPKPDWYKRKRDYIAHIATASEGAVRITAADKLHNARCIVTDLLVKGDLSPFDRFSVPMRDTLWFYTEVTQACFQRLPESRLVLSLVQTVAELDGIVHKLVQP
jgi:hypothetical protein